MYLPRRLSIRRVLKDAAEFEVRNRRLIVLLSCDTEFDPPSASQSWSRRSINGLMDGLPRLLELCDRQNIPATFFCEGKLAETFPELLRGLASGHEIGCHSYSHEWLGTKPPPRWIIHRRELPVLSPSSKEKVLKRAVEAIENITGKRPTSFRAPFNSVDHPSTLCLLEKAGFNADSSIPSYDNESFHHGFLYSPMRHASESYLWREGKMRLLEVPYMTRVQPLFFHPRVFREEVMVTLSRGFKLALESVDIQCRIDSLSGRGFSAVHVTSHPWEFSEIGPWGGSGRANANRLATYLEELTATYDVEFLTVHRFVKLWENKYCQLHSKAGP